MSGASLSGRCAIVTGATRGLGLEIARALGTAGASVYLCGRDPDAVEAAVETLAMEGLHVAGEAADVSNPLDADRLVTSTLERFGAFQILVNNAGIYGPKGSIDQVGWDDWVKAIEVNLFGSVLMCRAVLPHLRRNGYGKIVQLSGGGATAPLPNISAYAASKAAVIRFAETLAHEVRADGIDVNAIAPGALNTSMLEEVLTEGPDAVGTDFYERALVQQEEGGTPLSLGASLAVYLSSSQSDGISGRLISAVWDPWRSLAANREILASSDIYTLRRIVPEDRDVEWVT